MKTSPISLSDIELPSHHDIPNYLFEETEYEKSLSKESESVSKINELASEGIKTPKTQLECEPNLLQ